jgi:hypothetical protein
MDGVQVTQLSTSKVQKAIDSISNKELYVLQAEARVRIDSSAKEPRMLPGIQEAMQKRNWIEDQSSSIVLKASAGQDEPVARTYSMSRFGFGRGNTHDESEQRVSVSPWIQSVSIEYGGKSIWSDRRGGVPNSATINMFFAFALEIGLAVTQSD